jgi:hypothetical protein
MRKAIPRAGANSLLKTSVRPRVIPAKQESVPRWLSWMPACAGMTENGTERLVEGAKAGILWYFRCCVLDPPKGRDCNTVRFNSANAHSSQLRPPKSKSSFDDAFRAEGGELPEQSLVWQ